jgi:hypothetical protein
MASGHVTALTGRTHGCTDQQRDVKILLANSEPSTHGDDDVIRSSDLVAKLTADPERPWAEWKHCRPVTQNSWLVC